MAARWAFLAGLCLVVPGCERSSSTERPDEPTALDCTLSIYPPGATVVVSRDGAVVDRREVGNEPVRLTLQAGRYTVEAMKVGYDPFIERVTFGRDATRFAARLSPVLGELVIRSDPGVTIEAVDARGRTIPLGRIGSDGVRCITTLDAGRYTIRLSRPPHPPVTRPVELKPGRTEELQAELAQAHGSRD